MTTPRWSRIASAIAAAGWAVASVAAMTYGTVFNWSDFVHVDFGLPLTFATHTLSTIAGPADAWDLNLVALASDLLIWSVGMLLLALVAAARFKRRAWEY